MGLINNLPKESEERMRERAHQLKGEVRRRMFEAGGEATRSEAGDDALRRRVWQRRGARRRVLLELARLDFDLVRFLHLRELKDLSL
jgi:hypothetical protein